MLFPHHENEASQLGASPIKKLGKVFGDWPLNGFLVKLLIGPKRNWKVNSFWGKLGFFLKRNGNLKRITIGGKVLEEFIP